MITAEEFIGLVPPEAERSERPRSNGKAAIGKPATVFGEAFGPVPDCWTDFLLALDWTEAGREGNALAFLRPGEPSSACSGKVYLDEPHVLVVYSDAAGLPPGAGRKLTLFKVFAWLHFNGDRSYAASDIASYAEGIEGTVTGSVFAANPEALKHIRTYVKPMGGAAEEPATPPKAELFVNGYDFLTTEVVLTPVWGSEDGEICLSAPGETTMIVGPTGVGKSTLAHQLMYARLGLIPEVLGFAVTAGKGKVLYLAMDRPSQILRAMKRPFCEPWKDVVRDRLLIRRGPLPIEHNPLARPEALAELALAHGVDTIFVDSLKDIVISESDEVNAGTWNVCLQHLNAAGVEVFELHHNRKTGENTKVMSSIEDVYGSSKLTSGVGSVVTLYGEPGAVVVKLAQLKTPSGDFFPRDVILDKMTGGMSFYDGPDDPIMAVLTKAALTGAGQMRSVRQIAEAVYGKDWAKLSKNSQERVRSKLNRMLFKAELISSTMTNGDKCYRLAVIPTRLAET